MRRKVRAKKTKQKGGAILALSFFVLIISGLGLYYFIFAPSWSWIPKLNTKKQTPVVSQQVPENNIPVEENTCPDCQVSWLSGEMVAANQANAFPVAVVIDNDVLARPQSNLSQAPLVFEAPVEGGMTRFLAIFPSTATTSPVGPVRSARPYFLTWANEFHSLFIHCGGSPAALDQLKSDSKLYNLDEFFNGKYFKRIDKNKVAPHDLFTTSNFWQSYLDKRGIHERRGDSWLYKQEGEHASSSPDLSITFSLNFHTLWRYDAQNNRYLRFFNGQESRDETQQISAKNVLVEKVESKVLDEEGRLELGVTGSGDALICLDGSCQPGTWKRASNDRTRFYYQNGEEVKLNPGITWVEVADSWTKISY